MPTAPTKTDPASPFAANILIVDDQPENLSVLMGVLQARGYKVRPVTSGQLALEAARVLPPDLILLDISMAPLNGYEVCEALKRDPNLCAVPVIFISAFNETSDKVKGFGLGGVDYVTKPFQIAEVEARVSTHLELARLRKELLRHNELLVEAVAVRTAELVEANARLGLLDQAKSEFLGLVSHELRTPLCGIFGATEIVLDNYAHQAAPTDYAELVEMYAASRKRLLTMIADAELLAQISLQTDPPTADVCWLDVVVDEALGNAFVVAEARKVELRNESAGVGQIQAQVKGSSPSLVRALQSLFETAAKLARQNSVVQLSKVLAPGEISLIIATEGRTVPVGDLPRFFSLMALYSPVTDGGDLGLGPAVAERIVRFFGGAVAIENITPPGVRLTVRLKLAHALPKPE